MSSHQGKTPTPVVVHVHMPIKDRVGGIESAHEVGDHIILQNLDQTPIFSQNWLLSLREV